MDKFIFDKGANLPINHPVKLRYQDDVIPVFSMLGEKANPATCVDGLPLAGVEQKLSFINDEKNFLFLDFPVAEVSAGILDQDRRL